MTSRTDVTKTAVFAGVADSVKYRDFDELKKNIFNIQACKQGWDTLIYTHTLSSTSV